MELFDVYPRYDINIVKGLGSKVWDDQGNEYLDFYGGHAVISIGHCHPTWVEKVTKQAAKIPFYSNSIKMPESDSFATSLGHLSGYPDYNLFLCNSGAEANENAIKLASFQSKRRKIISFTGGFHGRTTLVSQITDCLGKKTEVGKSDDLLILPFGDLRSLDRALDQSVAAVIVEGVQGIGGAISPSAELLNFLAERCKKVGSFLILDEIQSGYGRTGTFFAHQNTEIKPDLITIAKGMGNGFPVAGVLISPQFEAEHGLLGTTFGGSHLAVAASQAVIEVIEKKKLVQNAAQIGEYLIKRLKEIPSIKEVRGRGLMVGAKFDRPTAHLRKTLLFEQKVFVGGAKDADMIRLLPPLNINRDEVDQLVDSIKEAVSKGS